MEHYRIGPETSVYFLTYSVVDWLPVFVSQASCGIITQSLTFCHHEKQLRINAYVVMPTHLHMIVFDRDSDTQRLNQTLTELRKFTGRRLCDHCGKHGPEYFKAALARSAHTDRERRFWQPSRHPEPIFTESFWREKLDYLHDNPCRKGLVRRADHWRCSSAAWYLSDGTSECDAPLTPIEW